jgi:hypothetical protein
VTNTPQIYVTPDGRKYASARVMAVAEAARQGQLNDDTCDTSTGRREQNSRAAAWFGLRGIGAKPCPRALAGGRCLDPEDCLCHHPVLDHARRWIDRNGGQVLTGEPYDLDGDDLARFIAACQNLGLVISIDGRSPWNPSNCFTVTIRRNHK